MTIGSEVIAQEAAFRLVVASCRGQSKLWNKHERLHAAAPSKAAAFAAARPLLMVCADCAIQTECRTWAAADEYRGVAGGTAWLDGKQRPAHWTHRHQSRVPRRPSSPTSPAAESDTGVAPAEGNAA